MQSEPQTALYLGDTEFSHSVDPKQGLLKTGLEGYGICFRSHFALYMLGNFRMKINKTRESGMLCLKTKVMECVCTEYNGTWSENIVGWIGVVLCV